jgi:UDP-N-acetylmuramyl pentapeptide phosphotransferase/UDP-N-acetylglucosamine-1-phosphate transferase
MQSSSALLVFALVYSVAALFYIWLARKWKITDKPNARSSHVESTVRGGGVVFPLAALVVSVDAFPGWPVFCGSLTLIAVLSFVDDLRNLSSRLRLVVQAVAIVWLLMFFDRQLDAWTLAVSCVLMIFIVNAYNFMDGINGITALYSIVTIGSLYWLNEYLVGLHPPSFFQSVLGALLAFSFFNIRKKAVCFAGDIGSVSIAFIICFLLSGVILATGSINWILLLGVYGIDAVFTVCCRIARGERILDAHRSHFYQYLANEKRIPHVLVSSIYALAQLLMNFIIICTYQSSSLLIAWAFLFGLFVIYVIFRLRLEGVNRLFVRYSIDFNS